MEGSEQETMTPSHPRWEEFFKRLEGPEGCNFRQNEAGNIVWNCDNTTERPFARKILADMGFDVERSLAQFEREGGYCDCEIVFNVGIPF